MKRLILIVITLSLIFLFSCQSQQYGILSYQEKNIEAECTLNGEYKILITKSNGRTDVKFTEPSELKSVGFYKENEKIYGYAGDTEIPFEYQDLAGVSSILCVFSLDEGTLASAVSKNDLACMEFTNELATYKITFGKNELPKQIEISSDDYELFLVVDAIKLN